MKWQIQRIDLIQDGKSIGLVELTNFDSWRAWYSDANGVLCPVQGNFTTMGVAQKAVKNAIKNRQRVFDILLGRI